MSGRIHPQDMVGALYEVVDDGRRSWLDDLLIAAGFMRRCPCTAMAPADEPCPICGGGAVDFFEVYRSTPEAEYTVDPLHDTDPVLLIRLAAHGSAHVGRGYAHTDWIYSMRLYGAVWQSGADLCVAGIAKSHAQMATILAGTLADRGIPAPLADRLTLWARQRQKAGDV